MTKPLDITHPVKNDRLKILLFGDPGTGKTRLASSAHLIEWMQPVLFGTAEAGVGSLADDKRFEDLDVVELTHKDITPEDVIDRVEALYDMSEKYNTVVIDTLTEVQRSGLHYLSKMPTDWRTAIKEPKKITLPEYGASLTQTGILVRAFRDLPCHVIMTAHVRRASLDVDGHTYVVPALTGQQWRDVLTVFDEVFFMYTKAAVSLRDAEKGVRYRIITKPFDDIKAKDRLFNLPVSLDITDQYLSHILQEAT